MTFAPSNIREKLLKITISSKNHTKMTFPLIFLKNRTFGLGTLILGMKNHLKHYQLSIHPYIGELFSGPNNYAEVRLCRSRGGLQGEGGHMPPQCATRV